MNIIYIIIFWLSIIGYWLNFKYTYKVKDELILGLTFICLSLVLFVLGLLNILKIGSILLLGLGIFELILQLKNNRKKILEDIKNPNYNIIIVASMLIYVTIVFSNFHLVHYDNFTHWGLIVKNMILYDKLPNFENASIIFQGYQPGSACFIYYFTNFFGLNEGMMIVAQNYLLIAFCSSIMLYTNRGKNILLTILSVFTIIFVSIANIYPHDLLVDTLLTTIFVYVFVLLKEYSKDMKKLFYILLIVSIYLCLIKNTGYVLVFIICCLYLFIGIKNKKFKEGLIGSIIIGISSLILLYIWTAHVKYVYGNVALYSHHALTKDNILLHLRTLGFDGIIKFLKIYCAAFIDLKNNVSSLIMLILNIICISFFFIYKNKKEKKYIINSLLIIDSIYIIYYIFLGIMYICSMEIDGLFVLAGFSRYLLTITISLVVAIIILFMDKCYNKNKKYLNLIYAFIIVFSMGFYMIKYKEYNLNQFKLFIGKTSYDNSYLKTLDDIITPEFNNMSGNETYYLYAPSYKNTWGLVMYATRYKTNHQTVKTCLDVDSIVDYKDDSLLILLEEDQKIKKFIDKNNFCEVSDRIFSKCKEEKDEN